MKCRYCLRSKKRRTISNCLIPPSFKTGLDGAFSQCLERVPGEYPMMI